MMKKSFLFIVTVLITFSFYSCSETGFQESESGLVYKFHEKNRGSGPSIDDVVKIDYAYRYPEDSLFFHSDMNNGPVYIPVIPRQYEGDIYDALRMMAKGDSATFKFDAERFFTITMGAMGVPEFVNPEDSIFVDLIMHDFFTEEEYAQYMEKQREEQMQEQEMAALNETRQLERYLQEQGIDKEPEDSGLIIIVEEEGSGPKPEPGQRIKVHYTGMVLDGTVFDSSVDRGTPIEFTLGRGEVIPGWEEGLSKLNVGSKARLIIPSYLAYGDRARSDVIQPFSTLIFDVELVDAQ